MTYTFDLHKYEKIDFKTYAYIGVLSLFCEQNNHAAPWSSLVGTFLCG